MKKLLPEVCTIQYGFPFDSAKFSDSNGMPLIRIRDVVRGYSETYTTEEYKSEYIVHENDLLIESLFSWSISLFSVISIHPPMVSLLISLFRENVRANTRLVTF